MRLFKSSLFFLIFWSQWSYSQCSITDSKSCEKTIYQINSNNQLKEIIIDSCGLIKEKLVFKYDIKNQCSDIVSNIFKTKLLYDATGKLTQSSLNISGTKLNNTYLYQGKNLRSIQTRMDMMGMKIESKTTLKYKNDAIVSINVIEFSTKTNISFVDYVEYYESNIDGAFNKNKQGIIDFTLGTYSGMGAYEALLDGQNKLIKSYVLIDPNTCDSPIKVLFQYDVANAKKPIVYKSKICNDEKSIEIHTFETDCN